MRLRVLRNIPKGKQTQGSKTLQYLEEEKSIEMLLVKAIEKGTGQTESACENVQRCGVAGLSFNRIALILSLLERSAKEGDSPVRENATM